MRTLRQFLSASVLTLILSISSVAGEISTGIAPQPAPTPAPAQGEISTTVNGTMHTSVSGEITTGATAEGVLAGAVVDLVQGVLSLL
jgi:hypothetical protein